VRYDITQKEATISLALAESFRGKGYGSNLILLGCKKLGQNSVIERINAYIKPDNLGSIRAFVRSGFREVGGKIVYDQQALHLIKNL
jgi:RimJ/RimL family protein N-acetyltransferase